MVTLMDQSCQALVAQCLLVDLFGCKNDWVLQVLWQVCVAQRWPIRGLESQLGAWVLKSCRELHILGLDAGPCIFCISSTNPPCLRVGRHSWYQSLTSIMRRWWPYFQKPTVRIFLHAHIRTIVILMGDKLTGIYFLYLLYVTMHRRHGKKVSILPPGDVNPGPVPSRWGLLEDNLYRVVGATVRRAMSHDHAPRACRDLGVSCGDLHKAWIRSCNVCSTVHTALNAWAPLEG
jgi:hypothetical protein